MEVETLETIGRTERAIIRELQRDGRSTYVDLARMVGVSEVTVRKKVTQLIDDGIISITVQANPFDLGFNAPCFIGMDVDRDAIEDVAIELAKLPEVEMVAVCNGYDIIAHVTTESTADLYRFIMQDLKRFTAIRDTRTFLAFKFFKRAAIRPIPIESDQTH